MGDRTAFQITILDRLLDEDDEVVVRLPDGWSLRSGSPILGLVSGDYVRLCRPDGTEYLYWHHDEWRDDPAIVMGAIINAAAGYRPEELGA